MGDGMQWEADVYDTGADKIGIAENHSVRSLIDLTCRTGQDILPVEIPGLIFPRSHIPKQERMLFAHLVIHPAHGEILTGIADATERRQAT
jgi:hypothetical protein